MALESGHYEQATAKEVYVWPAHSPDGEGEEIWQDQIDGQGRNIGRMAVKDNQGRPLRKSLPPEDFINLTSYDNSDNYVLSRDGRTPWRNANGEAVGLAPGQAVVIHADGTHTLLPDEYAQYVFEKSHKRVSGSDVPDVAPPTSEEEEQAKKDAADRAEFEAWKNERAKESV